MAMQFRCVRCAATVFPESDRCSTSANRWRSCGEALATHAEGVPDAIEFHYDTRAHALMQDEDGRIQGIKAVGPGNRPLEFKAPNVVLASGGFRVTRKC